MVSITPSDSTERRAALAGIGLMAAGIFLLRRRTDYRPAYRVWGFPWVPVVFVVASATIVVNRLISDPLDSLAGSLSGTESLFVFHTRRYGDQPQAVRGRGAGADLTASGVLGDILGVRG